MKRIILTLLLIFQVNNHAGSTLCTTSELYLDQAVNYLTELADSDQLFIEHVYYGEIVVGTETQAFKKIIENLQISPFKFFKATVEETTIPYTELNRLGISKKDRLIRLDVELACNGEYFISAQ